MIILVVLLTHAYTEEKRHATNLLEGFAYTLSVLSDQLSHHPTIPSAQAASSLGEDAADESVEVGMIVSVEGDVIRVSEELEDDVTEALQSVSFANETLETARTTVNSLAVQHLVLWYTCVPYLTTHPVCGRVAEP